MAGAGAHSQTTLFPQFVPLLRLAPPPIPTRPIQLLAIPWPQSFAPALLLLCVPPLSPTLGLSISSFGKPLPVPSFVFWQLHTCFRYSFPTLLARPRPLKVRVVLLTFSATTPLFRNSRFSACFTIDRPSTQNRRLCYEQETPFYLERRRQPLIGPITAIASLAFSSAPVTLSLLVATNRNLFLAIEVISSHHRSHILLFFLQTWLSHHRCRAPRISKKTCCPSLILPSLPI